MCKHNNTSKGKDYIPQSHKNGFAVIELIVVLFILLLISSLTLPIILQNKPYSLNIKELTSRVCWLLRLVQAEAALRGTRFILAIDPQDNLTPLKVYWEEDVFSKPGYFVKYNHPFANDTDWQQDMKILQAEVSALFPPYIEPKPGPVFIDEELNQKSLLKLYFFSDGTSDSLTLQIAPKSKSSSSVITLEGLTGIINYTIIN